MWAVGLDILTRSHFSLNSASRPTVGSANWGDISNKNISHVTQSTQVLLFSLYCDINTTYKLPLAQLLNKAQWIICTWATFFASHNQIPTQFHIPWGSLICWSVESINPVLRSYHDYIRCRQWPCLQTELHLHNCIFLDIIQYNFIGLQLGMYTAWFIASKS